MDNCVSKGSQLRQELVSVDRGIPASGCIVCGARSYSELASKRHGRDMSFVDGGERLAG